MNKLRNWDTTPAQMGGAFEPLTPGGHIVRILRAEIASSRNNGRGNHGRGSQLQQ